MNHAPQMWMCVILDMNDKCKQSFTWRNLERKNNGIHVLRTCKYGCCPEFFINNKLHNYCLLLTDKDRWGNWDKELPSDSPKVGSGKAGTWTQAVWLQSPSSLWPSALAWLHVQSGNIFTPRTKWPWILRNGLSSLKSRLKSKTPIPLSRWGWDSSWCSSCWSDCTSADSPQSHYIITLSYLLYRVFFLSAIK